MKTDFSINVQVNLGVTPEIAALVNAILCHRPTVVPTAEEALDGNSQVDNKPEDTTPAQPTNKRGRKKKEEAADKPEPTKEPAGDEQQEAAANEADANGEQVAKQREANEAAPQDEGQAKAQAEAEAEQKPLTAEDVRAAMHVTRQRIEGEDYKENTNGELYKKYHKPLTAQFKNIAALLGADKPSALPSDKIASFIEQCGELKILKDGTIGTECPY